MKKYLLAENTTTAKNRIETEEIQVGTAKKFLRLIKPLGFETFTSWSDIEETLNQFFPKASLLFNIQSQGLEAQFNEAKEHYQRFYSVMRFTEITEEERTTIIENAKVYTVNEVQNETYELVHRVVEDLNRLKELGLDINSHEINKVHGLFKGYCMDKPPIRVNQREFVYYISKLK